MQKNGRDLQWCNLGGKDILVLHSPANVLELLQVFVGNDIFENTCQIAMDIEVNFLEYFIKLCYHATKPNSV